MTFGRHCSNSARCSDWLSSLPAKSAIVRVNLRIRCFPVSSSARLETQRGLVLDLRQVLFGFSVPDPSNFRRWSIYAIGGKLVGEPMTRPLVFNAYCLADAQEAQAYTLRIDGQRCKDLHFIQPFLAVDNLVEIKLCTPGRTTRSGTEIRLEVEMHTPSVLN